MARKKSGGFNKVLEFIGLVDDEEPRDNYEDEYQSGSYGQQQPYVPARAQRPAQNQSRTSNVSTRRNSYEPTRTPRMSRSGYAADRYDAPRVQSGSARGSRAYVERDDGRRDDRYDYAPRSTARANSRFGSYEDDVSASASRYADDPQQRSALPQPRAPRGGARQRTVMFSLHALEDCCEVIDNLIMNNTVILTLDDLDPKMMQRAVDTLSGAVFALHATIRKASDRTYLIAPMTVEVNETYDVDRRF